MRADKQSDSWGEHIRRSTLLDRKEIIEEKVDGLLEELTNILDAEIKGIKFDSSFENLSLAEIDFRCLTFAVNNWWKIEGESANCQTCKYLKPTDSKKAKQRFVDPEIFPWTCAKTKFSAKKMVVKNCRHYEEAPEKEVVPAQASEPVQMELFG